jgi:ribonuclease VapC
MVVDSSAIVAVFVAEPEREALLEAMRAAPQRFTSAVSVLETCIVLYARTRDVQITAAVADFLHAMAIEVVPFDSFHASIASACYMRFGKGFHTAALNFGDCASYALASVLEEPLLFKGKDFAQTPITAVEY